MIAELELQKSVVTTLKGSAALMALVTGVLDGVPNDQAFPYISMGETTSTRWDHFAKKGTNVLFDLRIHSKYQGYKEAYDILDVADSLLNQQDLVVNGFSLTNLEREGIFTLTEDDGQSRQLTVRYRALLAPV